MTLIVILVFLSVFVVVALVAFAFGSEGSEQTKKVLATLNTALGTARIKAQEEVVDLRKTESFSNVPWMNRLLTHWKLPRA